MTDAKMIGKNSKIFAQFIKYKKTLETNETYPMQSHLFLPLKINDVNAKKYKGKKVKLNVLSIYPQFKQNTEIIERSLNIPTEHNINNTKIKFETFKLNKYILDSPENNIIVQQYRHIISFLTNACMPLEKYANITIFII